MRNHFSSAILCVLFVSLLGGGLPVAANSETSTMPLPETAEDRFAFYRAVLNGDPAEIRRLEDHAGESSFNHWLLGAARFRLDQFETAEEDFSTALRLGDLGALLAMAETQFRARNWIEAYAWSQIWVLEHYSQEEIAHGDAEGDPGMYLLRELLDRMNDRELERAEQLTEEYIRERLPELPEPEENCLLSADKCGRWEPTHREAPNYPREMLDRRYQGWVRSILLVDANGEVADVEVIFASRDEFVRPTRRALEGWAFAAVDGQDVESGTLFTQTIEYRLAR